MSDSLQPHGLQHVRLFCPSPTLAACSNSCPSSHWCHPTISSSVVPFSSCLLSFPASGSFPMSQLFASGGQSIGASASPLVLPLNIQDWFVLGNICIQKYVFLWAETVFPCVQFFAFLALESLMNFKKGRSPILWIWELCFHYSCIWEVRHELPGIIKKDVILHLGCL